MKFFNLLLFEYALSAIKRRGAKNIFILIIFFILIFLLSSVFFISNSLKKELSFTVDSLPDITIQKLQAGRQQDISLDVVDKLSQIEGISQISPRVWGYYYFKNAGANFAVVGVSRFDTNYKKSIQKVVDKFDKTLFDKPNTMIVGEGVRKVLKENYYDKYFNFIKPNGDFKRIYLAGVFKDGTLLESNDIILLSNENAREIFGMSEDKATDITLKVPNPKEVNEIATKIRLMYPNFRVITKNDLRISYNNIFDYKSGVFLALFIVALFTFFIIIYDKTSGLSSDEKREIGVQKAVGWKIGDIILQKFYEAFILSFVAFFSAVTFSLFYVYFLQAPILRDIFTGYSVLKPPFDLPFDLDFGTIVLIFFATVPLYIAATIIPSWFAATLEADEVIR